MKDIDLSAPENRVTGNLLRARAERDPDSSFLLVGDEQHSWGSVNEGANRIANSLRDLGVQSGHTVALLMENSAEMVYATFGINKLGAAWTPTNTAYRGEWLANTFEDGGADVLIVDAELLPRVLDLGDRVRFKHVIVNGDSDGGTSAFGDLLAGRADDPGVAVEATDLSAVMWTSGTTGRSKGVMQLHSTWTVCADVINRAREVHDGDTFYCCLPMYNSGGWVLNVYGALVAGAPIGIDRTFSVTDFWARCRHYGATQIFTLGAMHMYLWQAPPRSDDADNPVRVGMLVPIPPELIEPFKERFGMEHVVQGFGQSEVMPWTITYKGRDYKPGSTGVPREDLEVAVLDEHDERVPTGQVGEVCVRPKRPGVMFAGYYNQPEATLRAFQNLWYHSGDLARFDEDGELFFVDRKADFMRYKGRNISSFEVEAVLAKHPDVAEVAAHGVPAAELETEDEVKVCVVLRDGATTMPEDLARFVNDNAPHYMVPRYIEFVDELPHTPTGKVQKYLLRQKGNGEATWDREVAAFEVVR